MSRRVRAPREAPSVAALRLMMHFARADEDDGIAEPLARVRAACEGLPYRALARQFGGRRPLRRNRRRQRAAGHHAVWCDTVRGYDTAELLGLAPVDDAALAAHRRAGRSKREDNVGYGATYTAHRGASHRRRRMRLRRRLSASRAERHAGAGMRQERRMAGRVSMDMMTVDLSDGARGARRQPRRAVGRRLARRRRRRRQRPRSATSCCARSRRACRSSRAKSAASTSNCREEASCTSSSPAPPASSDRTSSGR